MYTGNWFKTKSIKNNFYTKRKYSPILKSFLSKTQITPLVILNVMMLFIYLPFVFLGYGVDIDIFGSLRAGENFFQTFKYVPSRPPGYFLFETGLYMLSQFGGYVLTNIFTVFLSILVVNFFVIILKYFNIRSWFLLAMCLIFHPYFMINASSSMDYLWALCFVCMGFVFGLHKHYLWSGVFWGLAIGVRLTSLIAVIFLFLYLIFHHRHGKLWFAFITLAVLSVLFYIPSFIWADYSINFLHALTGEHQLWTFYLRMGRWVYKNIYFWGLPSFVILGISIFIYFKDIRCKIRIPIVYFSIFIIISYLVLFFKYPLAIDYLLPILPFSLIVMGFVFDNKVHILILMSLILYNFFNVNIARPNVKNYATSAKYGLFIEKGPFLQHLKKRYQLRYCKTSDSWRQMQNCTEK